MRCSTRDRSLLLLSALIAVWLGAGGPAGADALTYSTRARTINAAILLIDSTAYNENGTARMNVHDVATPGKGGNAEAVGTDNPDPYVFYILNQRTDIKPFGWNIVNPLASRTVTGSIQQRWDARTSGSLAGDKYRDSRPGQHVYQLGQQITPNMAAYWELHLTDQTSLQNLLQYDILFINLRSDKNGVPFYARFTAPQVELLRRYVDAGGLLWVEDCGGGRIANGDKDSYNNTPSTAPLFWDMQFSGGTGGAVGTATVPLGPDGKPLHHPIIATPYLLTEQELSSLGDKQVGDYFSSATGGSGVPGPGLLATVVGNSAHGNLPVIAAGQLGAGEVVVTSMDSGCAINDYLPGGLNAGYGGNSGPYCAPGLFAAPTPDLKFLSDMLAWTSARTHERRSSRQNSSDPDTTTVAVTRTWSYSLPASAVPAGGSGVLPGAVIQGNVVYLRDSAGILRALDAFPPEDLDGDGNPDDGVVQDYSTGTSYDELWEANMDTSGGNSVPDPDGSAPTIANLPSNATPAPGKTVVLVTDHTGAVYVYDVHATVSPNPPISGGPLPGSGGGGGYVYGHVTSPDPSKKLVPGPAPSPTYYSGRVYAGQPDGTLYVYDFLSGKHGKFGPGAEGALPSDGPEYVTAAPTAGLASEGGAPINTNDIEVAVSTNKSVYSLFLGARGEQLQNTPNGTGQYGFIYSTKLTTWFPGITIDGSTSPGLRAYSLTYAANDNYPNFTNPGPTAAGSTFTFAAPGQGGQTLWGDYDVDPSSATGPGDGALTAGAVAGSSLDRVYPSSGVGIDARISAPAMDRQGNIYYTVTDPGTGDSSLFCVQPPYQLRPGEAKILWRFRLPFGTENVVDADGISYNALAGFQFVGAPVVDNSGHIFVTAASTSGNPELAVLSFSANFHATADMFTTGLSAGQNVSNVTLTQPVPASPSSTTNEFSEPVAPLYPGIQYSVSGGGHIDFNDFGQVINSPNPGVLQPSSAGIARHSFPYLSEPQTVAVSYRVSDPSNNNVPGPLIGPILVPLHSNLEWYVIAANVPGAQPLSLPVTGLTQAGSYLFLGDGAGHLCRVYAYPQADQMVNGSRAVSPLALNSSSKRMFQEVGGTGLGIAAAPSNSGGVIITNGLGGITAFSNQLTLIADSNRLIELDADGDAAWGLSTTSRTTILGGLLLPDAPGAALNPALATGQQTTTHLNFNRPSAISQLASNDYLVADTGNNRVVRVDRAGKVVWELSRFNPNGLLAPGEPATLSQPTGVQVYRTYPAAGGTIVHYLVADSGNYRILEVVDQYDASGAPVAPAHALNWVSHTYDQLGRKYRFGSVSLYYGGGKQYVVALVTNKRIAQLAPVQFDPASPPPVPVGTMAPANADAPGASLVLLDYVPAGTTSAGQKNGFISVVEASTGGATPKSYYQLAVVTSFKAYLYMADVPANNVTRGMFDINTAVADISAATNPGGGANTTLYIRNPRFLQAYTPRTSATQNLLYADDNGVFDLTAPQGGGFVAQWGFTPADFHAMVTPIDSKSGALNRSLLPFLPSSLQRTGTDQILAASGPPYVVGRYLIDTSFSQGETHAAGYGGEAFDVQTQQDPSSGLIFTREIHLDPNGGLLLPGKTFSRPINTGPLTQPTFAVRER